MNVLVTLYILKQGKIFFILYLGVNSMLDTRRVLKIFICCKFTYSKEKNRIFVISFYFQTYLLYFILYYFSVFNIIMLFKNMRLIVHNEMLSVF